MNPHNAIVRQGEPPLDKWKCRYCGAEGTYGHLLSVPCTYLYPACKTCGQTPLCAPDCEAMLHVLTSDPEADSVRYAPVLRRMVEILGAARNESVSFDEAMRRASAELNIPVPQHMVEPLLTSAFRVIASGRIPGAADA